MKNSARHGFRPGRFSSARLTHDAVTPKGVYLRRREFLIGAGAFAMSGGAALADPLKAAPSAWKVDEKLTPQEAVTTYNNFYEFGTDKSDPSANSGHYKPLPWTLEIGGMVQKPKTFDMRELIEKMPLEERIYRMRCVEAWSMVIPWIGFPLSSLLAQVEPLGSAKYVAFTGLKRPEEMPGQTGLFQVLDWPYVEGLRLDEAMHPLTILAVGLYGETLPKANGAPIRLVVPWKYGFKGIKAITKIEFVEKEPPTSWNLQAANEYGFYANVNPAVDHPRWSQATERRIGEDGFFGSSRRPTLPFNGYGEEVASLYAGMDLKVHY